jgi:hypothetical protein
MYVHDSTMLSRSSPESNVPRAEKGQQAKRSVSKGYKSTISMLQTSGFLKCYRQPSKAAIVSYRPLPPRVLIGCARKQF